MIELARHQRFDPAWFRRRDAGDPSRNEEGTNRVGHQPVDVGSGIARERIEHGQIDCGGHDAEKRARHGGTRREPPPPSPRRIKQRDDHNDERNHVCDEYRGLEPECIVLTRALAILVAPGLNHEIDEGDADDRRQGDDNAQDDPGRPKIMPGANLLGAGPVRQDHNQRQRSEEDRTNDKCRQRADVLVRVPVVLVPR